MKSFSMGGDPVKNMRKVSVDTSNNADMFGNIDKFDGRVPNGDSDGVLEVFLVDREIRWKISLEFCFGWRQLDVELAAEVKGKLKKKL